MNKFLESAAIALSAIWAAKLRSFMTVLGNIVAVTSIIAVVSLIQGLNASVKQAILNEAGADAFSVQQFPITRSDEEFDKVRSNPRISLHDLRAIRRYGSELISAVMADATGRGRITYRDKSIDGTQVEGVTGDYVNFSSFDAERGRLMSPKQADNFGLFTSDTILGIYHSATSGIFAVLIGVVGLSLVVGGIVIMNIMLMVVTERTREIGLRKALGARRSDISAQILTESVVLSMFGGGVGTVLGGAVAITIAAFTPIPASVEVWSIGLGIGITAAVGLFFGLYPAMRAARLDPIEALRKE